MFCGQVSLQLLPWWETAVWSVVCMSPQMLSYAEIPPQTAQIAAAPEALSNPSPKSGSAGSCWRLTAPAAGTCVDLKKGTNPKPACGYHCHKPTGHRRGLITTLRRGKRNGCICLTSVLRSMCSSSTAVPQREALALQQLCKFPLDQ